MSGLTKEFIAERDSRIFQMKKQGVSTQEIAKRVGVSAATVNASVSRTLQKLSAEALMAYPSILQLELERMDSLLASAWPLTQHRKVRLPDGTEIVQEPDVKFIQQAREIIKDRIKLLGLETTNVTVTNGSPEPIRHTIPSVVEAVAIDAHDPETEARKLMEIMEKAGILTEPLALGAGEPNE
jgi:AcrR family transcriptional regulator